MLNNPLVDNLLIALIIAAAPALLGRILKSVIGALLHRTPTEEHTGIRYRILHILESRIVFICILAGFSLAIREIRSGVPEGNLTQREILEYSSILIYVLFALLLANIASRFFRESMEWYSGGIAAKNRSDIAVTFVPLASKLVNIVISLIVVMILLDHFGVNIGGLLVSLGVGSLAIALAAQETIANMIAWFVILVDQPIRIGDRVRLPGGEEGDVFQIGLRSTRILAYDNNLIIVPNGELIKNRLVNMSAPDTSTSISIEVVVAHGTDISRARDIVLKLAAAGNDILPVPAPQLYVTGLADIGIQLRFIGRTADVTRKFLIETSLREALCREFASAGIRFPEVQRVIQAK
jgi:MscS family membrane protein